MGGLLNQAKISGPLCYNIGHYCHSHATVIRKKEGHWKKGAVAKICCYAMLI